MVNIVRIVVRIVKDGSMAIAKIDVKMMNVGAEVDVYHAAAQVWNGMDMSVLVKGSRMVVL